MFEILQAPIGRFDAYRLYNKETDEYLEVLSEMGAGLNDLVVKNKNGDRVSLLEGYRSDGEIQNTHHVKFRGSKLSPYPNRITEGKFTFDGKEYQFPVNEVSTNNQLHALLHCRPFVLEQQESTASSACIVLSHVYKGTDQGYPWPYTIQIEYTMTEEGITVNTRITNDGKNDMPLGDGWHPYFKFNSIDNVHLEMSKAKRVSSLVGNPLGDIHGFESSKIIGSTRMDDCFEVNSDSGPFEVIITDKESGIRVCTWQENGQGQYRYLQLFTPDSRDEIAVEPVTCPPNSFNTGNSLIVLKEEESVEMKMGIKFSTI